MKWNSINKPFKKLLVSQGGSTAGRNSKGRITIFHRGGGVKRLQRIVDLKRSTPAVGFVERIDYDPNRSAKLALVRWTEGVRPPNERDGEKGFNYSQKTVDPISANVIGQFPLSCLATGVRVANPLHRDGNKLNSAKDVFFSAFASKKAKDTTISKLPRIAVCGARPSVFVPRSVEQLVEGENMFALSDVQRWDKDSAFWKRQLKPKASVLWSSFVKEEPIGLAIAAHDRETKPLVKSSKKKGGMAGRTALTYIIASSDMEPGKMVMNVASPKESARSSKF